LWSSLLAAGVVIFVSRIIDREMQRMENHSLAAEALEEIETLKVSPRGFEGSKLGKEMGW